MGLGDTFKSLVLTEYKADTKQMRKELKKLSKEQQAQAKDAIDAAEKQNDAIDAQIAMLGKAALAVGAVTAAYAAAKVGIEAYEKRSRLASATAGADLKGLQKATKGLVSETRLLEFASKAMNGTFKLSQAQMEQALSGAVALRKTLGVELPHAMERMQQAIVEASTEPLKELGLVVKGVENDTREGLMAALGELAEQARLAGPDMALPGDEMAESQIRMQDAVENLKISLGKLAQSLAPVIAKLASLVGLLERAAVFTFDGPEHISGGLGGAYKLGMKQKFRDSAVGQTQLLLQQRLGMINKGIAAQADRQRRVGQVQSEWDKLQIELNKKRSGRKSGGSGGEYTFGGQVIDDGLGGTSTGGDMFRSGLYAEANSFRGKTAAAAQGSGAAAAEALRVQRLEYEKLVELRNEAIQARTNMLAGIFGTPAEIDATVEALAALSSGFDGLSNAFGAGVDALITGSSSFSEAFKKAIADSLRSMSVDMAVRAFRELAMAAGQLALGNVASAKMHGKAAALYGAGAVAAGVGARSLGAGGSNVNAPRTAGSAGVGASSGGPGGSDGGNTSVFIVGNDFAGMNARQREAMWRQTSRAAGVQIEGDVIVDG